MKIKLNKTYLTRDNRKVRIICTDRKSKSGTVVIGLVTIASKNDLIYTYYSDGRYLNDRIHKNDLVKEYSLE